MTEPFYRLVSPGTTAYGRLFVEIRYTRQEEGKYRLALMGVEGPKRNGDATGSCGQCIDALDRLISYSPDWGTAKVRELARVWDAWHLNDTRADTPWQREWLASQGWPGPNRRDPQADGGRPARWDGLTVSSWALDNCPNDPETDYRYGTAWLYEEVPVEVLTWLQGLPESAYIYPWSRSY